MTGYFHIMKFANDTVDLPPVSIFSPDTPEGAARLADRVAELIQQCGPITSLRIERVVAVVGA